MNDNQTRYDHVFRNATLFDGSGAPLIGEDAGSRSDQPASWIRELPKLCTGMAADT